MKFAVIGSAHGHIYEVISDMMGAGGELTGVYNDGSGISVDIAGRYKVPLYNDMDELLRSGVEMAGTSAINNEKIGIIEKCGAYGVHIIADKPIVADEDQYTRLEKVIEKGNIEVGLMLTMRFMPELYTVKKLVEEGAIGKLISVEVFSPHRLMPEKRPDWHFEKDKNGGIIIDLMIHSIDLYNWLTQSKVTNYTGTVTKSILKEKENFFDSSQFFVNSENGVTGYFRVDWHMPDSHWNWGDMRVYCTGSKGCIEARALGDPLTREPAVILYEEGRATEKIQPVKIEGSVTKDFINRINKKEHIITHKDILDATRLSIEFDMSARKIHL